MEQIHDVDLYHIRRPYLCRIPDRVWLYAQHQPRMAEADRSFQHGPDYVYDIYADLIERSDGDGRGGGARSQPEAGLPISGSDNSRRPYLPGLSGIRMESPD